MPAGKLKLMSDVQKSYMAGIIDADGCINLSMYSKKRYRNLCFDSVIAVEMAGNRVPMYLLNVTGIGHIHSRIRPGREKMMFRWQVSGNEADAFIKEIKPFLVLKGRQAEIFIEFRKTVNSKRTAKLDFFVIDIRKGLIQELRDQRYA